MSFLLVSCIYDNNNKKLLGYRAIDLQSYTAHNLLIDEQTCVDNNTKPTSLAKEQFLNAVYDDFFDRLTSTGTVSITDYPHISIKSFGVLTKNALTVLAIIDDNNGQEVGVICFSASGERFNYSFENFAKATERLTPTNYEMRNNRPYPNNGSTDFPHIKMQSQTTSRVYNSAKGEKKPDLQQTNGIPQPVKRRGRPPKNSVQQPSTPMDTTTTIKQEQDSTVQPVKKRGRPPKNANTVQVPVPTSNMREEQRVTTVASDKGIGTDDTSASQSIGTSISSDVPTSVGSMSSDQQGPYKLPKDPNGLPTLGVYSLDSLKSNAELSYSAQQKMYSALMNLRKLAPYYSTIYEAIDKKLVPGFGTFGVTEKRMLYDYTLPAELSVGEISFVLIHEMMHICMLHSVRKGSRDPKLWNIATDLYINTVICHDFEITFGDRERTMPNGGVIKCPPFGVFLETIDECLDLSKDTPEVIYKILYEENKQQQNQQNQQGQQGQQGGQSGQQQGGQSDQQQGGQNGQQQGGQNGQQQGGQSDQQQGGQNGQQQGNQSGQSGQQQGNQSGKDSQNGQQQGGQNGQENQGQQGDQNNQNETNEVQGNGENENPAIKEVSVSYNGKKLIGKVMMDICTENNEGTKESAEKNVQDIKKTLAKINTKIKMEEMKKGFKLSKDVGMGGDLTQRNIEFGLAQGINWRVLLKNISMQDPKKLYVLSKPNKSRMNLGMTMATRQQIGEPQKASNFVIAIDVSGSVSKQKLDYFLSEVNSLSKKYEVEGELVYWSTEVGDAGKFSDMKDLLKVKPKSTGGTNVKCLFEYLMGKRKTQTGKTEEMKIKDIKGVFIITDGYFAKNYGEYASYFDRRVVWLIDGNPVLFDNLFGRVIGLESPED